MDYGFIFYFLSEPNWLPLARFFVDLQKKIQIHEHHTEITTSLYRNEYKNKVEQLKSAFSEPFRLAKENYKKVFDETKGEWEDKHSWASHDSGIDDIESQFGNESEFLSNTFSSMADHYNKSALVSIYALLESELNSLCSLLQTQFDRKVSLSDLDNRDYYKTALKYIKLVIEIPIESLEKFTSKLNDLQYLRNRIMHNGGEFETEKVPQLEMAINTSDGLLKLVKNESTGRFDLRVMKGEYIYSYYQIIRDLFYNVQWLVEEKTEYQLLIERLKFLFCFFGADATVKVNEVKNITHGKQISIAINLTNEGKSVELNCNLNISKSKVNDTVITNQLANDLFKKELGYFESNTSIIPEILNGFYLPSDYVKVDMTFF